MKRLTAVMAVLLVCSFSPALAQSGHHGDQHKTAVKAESSDQIWAELAAGNQRFVAGKTRVRSDISRRKELAKGQQPRIAVLSCSDSRVPPEILFDQGLGDLFVVRSAGNSADPIGIGSLEYAVEHLGSTVIVVLGHQSCGAVKAACSGEKMPSANLDAVVKPVYSSCAAAKQTSSGDELINFAVRDHVHASAHDLLAHSEILKHSVHEGKLGIIEAYYNLETGLVERLH